MTKHVVPPRGRGDNSRIGFHGFGGVIFRKRQGYEYLIDLAMRLANGDLPEAPVCRPASVGCGVVIPFRFRQ